MMKIIIRGDKLAKIMNGGIKNFNYCILQHKVNEV